MDHEQSTSNGSFEENAGEAPEVVDGVLVVASVRAVETVREGPPPFVAVAAVAATGFVAGAATAAVLGRRLSRAQARRVPSPAVGAPLRRRDPLEVLASQRFIVDVHTLARR